MPVPAVAVPLLPTVLLSDEEIAAPLLPSASAPPVVAFGADPAEMVVEEVSPLAVLSPELAIPVLFTEPWACVDPAADVPPEPAPPAAFVLPLAAEVPLLPLCPVPLAPPLPAAAAPLLLTDVL